MVTEKAIALCLMTGGKDKISTNDIQKYAKLLGVTTRSIYRYLDKIWRAKLLINDFDGTEFAGEEQNRTVRI